MGEVWDEGVTKSVDSSNSADGDARTVMPCRLIGRVLVGCPGPVDS